VVWIFKATGMSQGWLLNNIGVPNLCEEVDAVSVGFSWTGRIGMVCTWCDLGMGLPSDIQVLINGLLSLTGVAQQVIRNSNNPPSISLTE
jgi:hypothetical protein